MNLAPGEQKIIDTVDTLTDDIIGFACRLVAEPSTLGKEKSVLAVMEAQLESLGLAPRRIPIDPDVLSAHPGFAPVPWGYADRYCLAATQPPAGSGGRSALFNGHLDVVSPEPIRFWQQDPFDPRIRDGWLYGRGAGDMKAGVAAMLYALQSVKKAGFGLKAALTIETVIEEECSGNGALACLAAGCDADAVLIPEPFGPTLLTAQLGVLWFKVCVEGAPSHVQSAASGTNAVEKCHLLIRALHRLEAELNAEDRPAAYRGMEHPINLNIGIFKGGDWPSTVPAEAEFHGRLAYFPGVAYEQVRRRVAAAIAAAADSDPWLAANRPQVQFYGFRSDGHRLSRRQPALAQLNACHRALTGEDAMEYTATCTTDLRAFVHFGRGQATCYGPVAENIHAANERVRLDSVIATARVYALFLARWCGLAE